MTTNYSRIPANERPAAVEYLTRFGLHAQDIADHLGWSEGTIRNDVQQLGGYDTLTATLPRDPRERYRNGLKAYAVLMLNNDFHSWTFGALYHHLDIPSVSTALEAVRLTIFALTTPDQPDDTTKLWSVCYPINEPKTNTAENAVFERIRSGEGVVPGSVHDLIVLLVNELPKQYRELVAPALTEEDRAVITEAFGEVLTRVQRQVLRQHLGLTDPETGKREAPLTLSQVGSNMNLTANRIKRILAEAIGRLRAELDGNPRLQRFGQMPHQQHLNDVVEIALNRGLGKRLKVAEDRVAVLEAQLKAAGIEPEGKKEWNENLFKRCDALELSVRSQNILQNAGIEFVWQLVEKTEDQLLAKRNFGRKVLNEIKEILNDLGLSIGMNLEGFPKTRTLGR